MHPPLTLRSPWPGNGPTNGAPVDLHVREPQAMDIEKAVAILETILFALFTLLIIWFVRVRSRPQKRSHGPLNPACVSMYTLAAVHWAFTIRYFRTGRHEALDFDSSFSKLSWKATISPIQMGPAERTDPSKDHIQPCFTAQHGALLAMVLVNMLANDAIVIWRAHILWSHNRRYQIISCWLICAMGLSFAFSILSIIYTQAGRNPLQRHNSNNSLSTALSFGISWLSNVWATHLTRLKTREHYDEVQRVLPVCHYHTPTERVLGLFLRSGLTFTFLWTLLLLITILDHMVPANDIGVHRIIDVIIYAAPIHIAGMYPTILTILVVKTESYDGRALNYSDVPTPLLSPVDEAPSTERLPLPESFEDEDHNGDSVTPLVLHPGSTSSA